MALQIWYFADIENILWAMQTVLQASLATPAGHDQPAIYHSEFQRNFAATLHRIAASVERSQEIWSRQGVEDMLLAVQAGLLLADAGEGSPGDHIEVVNHGIEAAMQSAATAFGVNLFAPRVKAAPENASFTSASPLFGDDIQAILLAIETVIQQILTASTQPAEFAAYTQGFETALNCIARLFGIRLLLPAELSTEEKQSFFWVRLEIEKKLQTLYDTIPMPDLSLVNSAKSVAYRQGFRAAIQCVGLSFGLNGLDKS